MSVDDGRCDGCGEWLGVRPVLCTVKSPQTASGLVNKHVRKKPAQLVVAVRVEGSLGLTPEFFAAVDRWALRLCLKCVGGAGSVPAAIAVALDKRQERTR